MDLLQRFRTALDRKVASFAVEWLRRDRDLKREARRSELDLRLLTTRVKRSRRSLRHKQCVVATKCVFEMSQGELVRVSRRLRNSFPYSIANTHTTATLK